MVETIDRKIYFYRIEFKKNGQATQPQPIFSNIESLPFDENGRYLPLDDGNMRSMYIDSTNPLLKARIGTIRKKELPLMERKGETEPLTIPPDAGLYEPIHFMIFPNNVVGFEYNFYGPRIGSLKAYIHSKASDLVDEIELVPLMRRDIQELLSRIGEIRVFKLRVHRDMESHLRELDDNLSDAFKALKQTTDAEYIEIVLKSKRYSKDNISVLFFNRLRNWLSHSEVRVGVDDLRVRARDETTGGMENFDLLQEYLLSVKQVVKQDDVHRSVNTSAMYAAINEAYRDLRPEIDCIINEGNIQ